MDLRLAFFWGGGDGAGGLGIVGPGLAMVAVSNFALACWASMEKPPMMEVGLVLVLATGAGAAGAAAALAKSLSWNLGCITGAGGGAGES